MGRSTGMTQARTIPSPDLKTRSSNTSSPGVASSRCSMIRVMGCPYRRAARVPRLLRRNAGWAVTDEDEPVYFFSDRFSRVYLVGVGLQRVHAVLEVFVRQSSQEGVDA